jgi:hypothetical protein
VSDLLLAFLSCNTDVRSYHTYTGSGLLALSAAEDFHSYLPQRLQSRASKSDLIIIVCGSLNDQPIIFIYSVL